MTALSLEVAEPPPATSRGRRKVVTAFTLPQAPAEAVLALAALVAKVLAVVSEVSPMAAYRVLAAVAVRQPATRIFPSAARRRIVFRVRKCRKMSAKRWAGSTACQLWEFRTRKEASAVPVQDTTMAYTSVAFRVAEGT